MRLIIAYLYILMEIFTTSRILALPRLRMITVQAAFQFFLQYLQAAVIPPVAIAGR